MSLHGQESFGPHGAPKMKSSQKDRVQEHGWAGKMPTPSPIPSQTLPRLHQQCNPNTCVWEEVKDEHTQNLSTSLQEAPAFCLPDGSWCPGPCEQRRLEQGSRPACWFSSPDTREGPVSRAGRTGPASFLLSRLKSTPVQTRHSVLWGSGWKGSESRHLQMGMKALKWSCGTGVDGWSRTTGQTCFRTGLRPRASTPLLSLGAEPTLENAVWVKSGDSGSTQMATDLVTLHV